jgi:small subunit ribosomal protein S20
VAHSLSAQKRVRQNLKHRTTNKAVKSELKSEIKKLLGLIHDKNVDGAKECLKAVYKELDQVAAKGMIHKNMADRKKSRLALRVAAMSAAPAAATKAS